MKVVVLRVIRLTSKDVFVVWYTAMLSDRLIATQRRDVLYNVNLTQISLLGLFPERSGTHEKKATEKYLLKR